MNFLVQLLFFLLIIINAGFCQNANQHNHSPNDSKHSIQFIQNKTQWEKNIKYRAELPSGLLFLESNSFTYNFFDGKAMAEAIGHGHNNQDSQNASRTEAEASKKIKFHGLKANFKNSNKTVKLLSHNPSAHYNNYFIGNDQSKWSSEVYGFSKVTYTQLYNNINLVIYSQEELIKYDFEVSPGGNVSDILLEYQGAENIKIDYGNLIIKTSVNEVFEQKPYAYQIIREKEVPVTCRFVLNGNQVMFDFPNGYDRTHKLIIDPTLIFSSYSGSFANNFGYTATFDNEGFLYSGSSVFSAGYPTTIGAYDMTFNGGNVDIAISKYDTTGTKLIYSTYIGGSSSELPHSLIVDPQKNELLIFGTTSSLNYPTTAGSYNTTFNGGSVINLSSGLGLTYNNGSDMVITRLSTYGNRLEGSTYVGGSGNDGVNSLNGSFFTSIYNPLKYNYADEVRGEIMLDNSGNVYVVSCTRSSDFPIVGNTFQTTFGGGLLDGVIVKLDGNLTTMIWSSYLGGSDVDAAFGIALDEQENIYVTGGTKSSDFPVTPGVVYPNFGGGRSDGFISHIDKNGQQIKHSTYFASPAYDQTYLVQTDRKNNVFVVGQTQAPANTFIKNAAYNTPGAGQFITKLSPELDSIAWSTRFGTNIGVPNISPVSFLVDLCSKVYLSGWGGPQVNHFGGTNGMDVTPDAFQSTTDNNDFYLMIMEDDASALNYASFYGGPLSAEHVDGGTSRFDKLGKIYQSVCAGCNYSTGTGKGNSDFPIFPDSAVSPINNSYCNNAVFKFDFGLPEISADFSVPPPGCLPYTANFTNTSINGKTYYWDFGDGDTSTAFNPIHIYNTPGIYNVMLITFDTLSCNVSDTAIKPLLVIGDTSYILPDKYVCGNNNQQIGLPYMNTDSLTIKWIPSVGLSDSTVVNPIANPDTTTNYVLIVSYNSCVDTFFQKVIVIPQNISIFSDSTICKSDSIKITVTGEGAYSFFTFSTFPDFSSPIYQGTDTSITVFPSNTTIYYVKGSNSNCFVSDNIVVNVLRDTSYSLPPVYSCNNSPKQIGISPLPGNNINYAWLPTVGLNDSTISNPIATLTNNTTYQLVISNGQCADTVSQTVNVLKSSFNSLPTLSTCPNAPVQIGLDIEEQPGIGFIWFGNGSVVSYEPNPIVTPATTTNYQMYLSNGQCYDYYVQQVIVYNNVIKNPDTLMCPGSTITIGTSGSNFYTDGYIFSSNPQFSDTLNASVLDSTLTLSPTQSTTIYLNAISQQCNTVDSILINMLNDTTYFLPEASICPGESIEIGITPYNDPITTYSWNPITYLDYSDIANPIATPDSSTNYILVVTNGNCTDTIYQSLKITFLEIDTSPDTSICEGSYVTLFSSSSKPFVEYFWSSNESFTDTLNLSSNDSTLTINPNNNTTYYCMATLNGCRVIDSVHVTVLSKDLKIITDSTVCKNDVINLWASSIGLNNFQWSSSINFADTLNVSVADSSVLITMLNNNVYYLKGSNGQCMVIDSVEIGVINNIQNLSSNSLICFGDSAFIGIDSLPGDNVNYTWSPVANTTTHIYVNPSQSIDYILLVSNGVCTDTLVFPIEVNTISLIVSKDTVICQGNSLSIFASTQMPFSDYQWSSSDAFADTLNNLNDSNIIVAQAGTYYIQVSNKGCFKNDSVYIGVSGIEITTKNISLCLGDSIYLTAVGTNPGENLNYVWEPANAVIGSNTMDSALIKPSASSNYYVTASNQYQCTDKDTVQVIVSALPSINFAVSATPDTINTGENTILQVNPSSGYNFEWSPSSIVNDYTNASTSSSPTQTTTYYIKIDDGICYKNDSVTVYVFEIICGEPNIYIPDAFTPNTDNTNDKVFVRGNNIKEMYFTIYNRWGEKIFETKDQNTGWDGTYNTMICDPGVFVYYLTITCDDSQTYFLKGNITLIR